GPSGRCPLLRTPPPPPAAVPPAGRAVLVARRPSPRPPPPRRRVQRDAVLVATAHADRALGAARAAGVLLLGSQAGVAVAAHAGEIRPCRVAPVAVPVMHVGRRCGVADGAGRFLEADAAAQRLPFAGAVEAGLGPGLGAGH